MGYNKGQILTYHFPERKLRKLKKTNVISEYHRAVILHKRQTPYNTVLIAPITKAASLQTNSSIPLNYVKLAKTDYPFVLEQDSYINLDMVMVVDFDELEKLSRYEKSITAILNEADMYQLDYKITLTYELSKFIQSQIGIELQREFENVIEFIDIDVRNKIKDIVQKINNKELMTEIIEVIDFLVGQIKNTYIRKK